MTDIELQTLAALSAGPLSAADIGWELWGAGHVGGGTGSHMNNKFCRAAGRVLHRMKRRGLVEVVYDGRRSRWALTSKALNKGNGS